MGYCISADARPRRAQTLASALRHSEEAATRGAAALELQQKVESLQAELAVSYKARALPYEHERVAALRRMRHDTGVRRSKPGGACGT